MSHYGHPILFAAGALFAATLWFAHGKAAEDNRYRTEKTQITAPVSYGFADLGVAKSFYRLVTINDAVAALKLFDASKGADMAIEFSTGQTVSVDDEEEGANPYVCIRPFGDPDCYWAPAAIAFQSAPKIK